MIIHLDMEQNSGDAFTARAQARRKAIGRNAFGQMASQLLCGISTIL
ncbi:hypothetical protein [Planococcus chinensis]|nr:hypothetical protein [Planococcus chinensis]